MWSLITDYSQIDSLSAEFIGGRIGPTPRPPNQVQKCEATGSLVQQPIGLKIEIHEIHEIHQNL